MEGREGFNSGVTVIGAEAPSAYHMAPRSEAPSQVPPPVPKATAGAIGVSPPGPREHVLQCFIRRNGVSKAYYMFLCLSSALVADDGKFITITLSQHFKHLQSASTASLPRLLANDAYLNRSHHHTKTIFIIWRTYQLVISPSQLERVETT
ncbi:hypothetical protein AAZX31_18G134500 [Glycine max]